MKKKLFLNSLKKSFSLIKKNLILIMVLFLLQVLFFISVSFISYKYLPNISEPLNEVSEYLANMDFGGNIASSAVGEGNVLGEDPLIIYRNLSSAFFYMKVWFLIVFFVYILFSGVSWGFTFSMVKKMDRRRFFSYFGRFFLVSLVSFSLVFVFLYYNLNPGMVTKGFPFGLLIIVFGLIFYFIYLSFCLVNKVKIKELPKRLFDIGVKKFYIVVFSYLVIAFFTGVFALFSIMTLEFSVVVSVIAILLFIFSVVWSRLFLILVIDGIS